MIGEADSAASNCIYSDDPESNGCVPDSNFGTGENGYEDDLDGYDLKRNEQLYIYKD